MAELVRGVEAGAVSGVFYGVINHPIINIILFGPENYYMLITEAGMGVLGCVIQYIIVGVTGGLILGLMFAALYGKLPGKKSAIKGIVISIIF